MIDTKNKQSTYAWCDTKMGHFFHSYEYDCCNNTVKKMQYTLYFHIDATNCNIFFITCRLSFAIRHTQNINGVLYSIYLVLPTK